MRRRSLALALLLGCLTSPAVAHAQFGDMLKNKVKKAAKDAVEKKAGGASADTASATPAAKGATGATANVYWEDVVELTEDVMVRFTNGLKEGARVRDSLRTVADAGERHQQEQLACMQKLGDDPKYQKLAAASDGKEGKEAMDAVQAAGNYILEKCGDGKQAERARMALDTMPEFRVVRVSGLTRNQVSIARERIVPFCKVMPAEPASGVASIPGQGGYSFVYSAAEVRAIKPRCGELTRLLDATG